jgi:AcrR family transcriptional regulator
MEDAARPRTKPADVRREELLAAAEQLFLAHGVEATTVDQITRAAGVAKGTFYLYFKSKDDVRTGLAERLAGRHRAAAAQIFPSLTPADRLRAWIEASVGFHLENAALRGLVGAADAGTIDELASLIASGAEAGAWSVDDAYATAAFIVGGLQLATDDARTRERHVIRSRLIRRAQRLCLRAVGLED